MDDFGWTKNVHDTPIKGTYWVITNLGPDTKFEAQQFLFNHGFKWASGHDVYQDYDIKYLSCLDKERVNSNCFGFNYEDYVIGRVIRGDIEVHVFEWVDGVCKFKELEKV
tara:strand:- start:184 stop:513 length:330 start_codon:yes stop_codon:yes gene_type:complete